LQEGTRGIKEAGGGSKPGNMAFWYYNNVHRTAEWIGKLTIQRAV